MVISAKIFGADLFVMADIMENSVIINELKFLEQSYEMHYNLYNYNCNDMSPQQIGYLSEIVM